MSTREGWKARFTTGRITCVELYGEQSDRILSALTRNIEERGSAELAGGEEVREPGLVEDRDQVRLFVRDAGGVEVYRRDLTANGTFQTAAGTAGQWRIRVELARAQGLL